MELPQTASALLWFVLACGLTVYLYGLNIVTRWRLRHIPGPKPRWLIGNIPDLAAKGIHKQRMEWQRQYGPIVLFWVGRRPAISVSSPKDARKIVLQLNDKRSLVNELTAPLLLQINKWFLPFVGAKDAKMLRNAWQPVFHSENLAGYAPPMREGADRLARRLEKAAEDGAEVNMWALLGDMTMDIVGTTAFGVDLQTQADESVTGSGTDPTTSFTAAASYVFKVGLSQIMIVKNPFAAMSLLFPVVKPLMLPLEQMARKLGLLPSIIKEYEAAGHVVCEKSVALTTAAKDTASAAEDSPAVGSFLQKLASTGKGMSDTQVAAQAYTFLLAGYETTANTLTFAMYLIASHEEVYRKAVAEVDAFGPAEPEFKQLVAFPYISAIISEALRMYPPVSATIPRVVDQPMELCGLRVPAVDAGIVVHIQHQHLDEANFKEPLVFKPERFLKGSPEYERPPPYAYMPFGGGARACIGEKFALEEMKLALVTILRRFRFELSPGQVPLRMSKAVTQSPAEGLFGRVYRR